MLILVEQLKKWNPPKNLDWSNLYLHIKLNEFKTC